VPVEYGPFPHVAQEVIRRDDRFVISRDYRGIVVRNRHDHHSMPEFVSHPIQTDADWARYKEAHLQPRLAERTARLGEFAAQAERMDAPIQLGCFPWGVFGTARDMMGAVQVLLALHDQPQLVADIMKTYTDLWLAIYETVCVRVRVDHIHIWEDMSGRQGSLISMAMVEEFMMPHYDRVAAFAQRHDVPLVSVDSDGRVDELVPTMMRHGVNMFLPFEVQAGNDIEEYRRRYPALGISGGIDKNVLAGTQADVHRELAKVERMLAHGRFIPGCDHLIPPNVPWTNWKYFCENLRKICGA
jgi:uroporphyrinogen decarboxylase